MVRGINGFGLPWNRSHCFWTPSVSIYFSCDNCLSTTKASATEACTAGTAGEELNGRSRCFPSPETAAVLKRTVEALMEKGAVVRNLENLGERALPYKISKHKQRHRRGGYFLVDLEGPPSIVSTMMDHLGRDIDVIRRAFIKHPVSKTEECSGIIPVNTEDKLTAKKK
ncbi:28S ribosomal protein S6, mitochondrial isoform X1 [Oxyura jamaicensis]|uniref:28S ribosomal protein S6, mitochondrial isoform X1 n=1 Tax=Oxyura jamaicensis TaxID=8884 RepID=UPI0015A6F993|nr:28S ribosomal protein S6, mitochondrial isoform X1 [Oxyura jamaicensis]